MYPFWDFAVAPVLKAADARRIVEIGALRGETTAFMLDELGADAELHVIDPVPVFDPSEHEERFPGRYLFHRALSLEVLPDLPPMDAALIDGDHNWYTVYHELRALSETARSNDRPLPVLILHDVGWPYGRRDLYYVPEQIPEEFRQPYAQQGMLPGRSELVEQGGLNPTNCNATHEGGPRNGVMTAVDDFIAEYDRPLRLVFLPAYFGLAIVVEEARLDEQPALRDHLDWLEGAGGQAAMVEMAEAVRLDSMMVQHTVFFSSKERTTAAAHRYLGLLKGALLNEHYLEQEVRINYLLECLDRGAPPRPEALRDPARQLTEDLERLRTARIAGVTFDDEGPVGSVPLHHRGSRSAGPARGVAGHRPRRRRGWRPGRRGHGPRGCRHLVPRLPGGLRDHRAPGVGGRPLPGPPGGPPRARRDRGSRRRPGSRRDR